MRWVATTTSNRSPHIRYHLLATIENLLRRKGDTRKWLILRDVMSTLTRGTVMFRDDKDATYSIRLTGEPEDVHQDILNKLDIQPSMKTVISKIPALCSDQKN